MKLTFTGKRTRSFQVAWNADFPKFGLFALLALTFVSRTSAAPTESPDLAVLAERVEQMIHQAAAATPVPTVTGPDSLLFLFYDTDSKVFDLGRREAAQSDKENGSILAINVGLERPSVTGDGAVVLYVTPDYDLSVVATADFDSRQSLGLPGRIQSVAVSPDAKRAAVVFHDATTDQALGVITLLDLVATKAYVYNLPAPSVAGASVDGVLYADTMAFSADGTTLVYDAVTQLKFGNGPSVQRWGIFAIDLAHGQTSTLVPPQETLEFGNPAFSRAGSRYLIYDARQVASGSTTITVLDRTTGQAAGVATVSNGFGYPGFLGDESGFIYTAPDPGASVTGLSLFKQGLQADRLHAQNDASLLYQDADVGVIYRRSGSQGSVSNALPTVSLQISADSVPANGSVSLTAMATDSDGTIARVEFYDASTKLGQVDAGPYMFVWKNVPAGNHLLHARAIDNLGGGADSSPRFLTAAGSGNSSPPTVALQISSDTITTGGEVTLTAAATDSDGTIARVEFYDGPTNLGQIETRPYVFVWKGIPAGNHLLTARAIDNVGAQTTSSPRFLTVSGTPVPSDDPPHLNIKPVSRDTVRLTLTGRPGYYIITMSEDLHTWVDIYPLTIDASGRGELDDSGGPIHSNHLFYRVRRD